MGKDEEINQAADKAPPCCTPDDPCEPSYALCRCEVSANPHYH